MFFNMLVICWLILLTVFHVNFVSYVEDPDRAPFWDRLKARLSVLKFWKKKNKEVANGEEENKKG